MTEQLDAMSEPSVLPLVAVAYRSIGSAHDSLIRGLVVRGDNDLRVLLIPGRPDPVDGTSPGVEVVRVLRSWDAAGAATFAVASVAGNGDDEAALTDTLLNEWDDR
jgi:hypothetical protein